MPSSPAMPSVSVPEVGNGFYVPGSEGFYQGQRNVPAGTSKSSSSAQAENIDEKAEASSDIDSSDSGLSGYDYPDYYTAGDNSGADSAAKRLTADDISSLSSMGLFGSFSNLLGGNATGLTGASPAAAATMDTILLRRILSELEKLKTSVKEQNVSSSAQEERDSSAILRFIVNGTDILPMCQTVFFSEPEADGTFLLTGDCKYSLNGTVRTETFYFLFHAAGSRDGGPLFNVTPSLSQTTKDTSSYLFRLCQLKNLKASKTGNLITMRFSREDINVDMLLSL